MDSIRWQIIKYLFQEIIKMYLFTQRRKNPIGLIRQAKELLRNSLKLSRKGFIRRKKQYIPEVLAATSKGGRTLGVFKRCWMDVAK